MAGLLSRLTRTPSSGLNSYHTLAALTQLQPRLEPPEIGPDVGAAADRLQATTDLLEEGMLGVLQLHVHPAPLALLLDQAGRFQQLQVAANVGLRNLERVHQLADTQPSLDRGHAAGQAQPQRLTDQTDFLYQP